MAKKKRQPSKLKPSCSCGTLTVELREIKDENSCFKSQISRLERDLAFNEKELAKYKALGWNKQRGVKFRRLEVFYSRFINVMVRSSHRAPLDTIAKLQEVAKQELSHLPKDYWDDSMVDKESET